MSVTIRGSGQVPIQVVQTIKTDTFSTSSTSFTTITGLTATITPTSSLNKILVIVQVAYSGGNTNANHFKIIGGNTASYIGNANGSETQGVFGGYWNTNQTGILVSGNITYLDSPATTSATTYSVQTCKGSSGANPSQVNYAIGESANSDYIRGASSITVMEISGT
jgi:hypothetical protein